MGYFLRAFSTSTEPPPFGRLVEVAHAQGVRLAIAAERPVPLESPHWTHVEIEYAAGKLPLALEVARVEDPLLQEEVEEFIELVEDLPPSEGKKQVLSHLAATRLVAAVQLLDDSGDDALDAAGAILGFFVEHQGALVQADGEGFYEGRRLLVPLK